MAQQGLNAADFTLLFFLYKLPVTAYPAAVVQYPVPLSTIVSKRLRIILLKIQQNKKGYEGGIERVVEGGVAGCVVTH